MARREEIRITRTTYTTNLMRDPVGEFWWSCSCGDSGSRTRDKGKATNGGRTHLDAHLGG